MEVWFVEYAQGVKTSGGWISLTPGPSDYANMAVNPKDGTVYVMWFDDVTDTTTWELLYRWRDPMTRQWSGPLQVPVFVGRSKYLRDMVIDKNGKAHLAFILRSPTAAIQDKPGAFAPTNVAISSVVNKILFYEIRDPTITFVLNSNNAASDVDGYNVYRKKAAAGNSTMVFLGGVGATTFNYKEAGIRGGQKYANAVKTRFKDDRERGFSAVVTEQ
jgi:hypothetical protein